MHIYITGRILQLMFILCQNTTVHVHFICQNTTVNVHFICQNTTVNVHFMCQNTTVNVHFICHLVGILPVAVSLVNSLRKRVKKKLPLHQKSQRGQGSASFMVQPGALYCHFHKSQVGP